MTWHLDGAPVPIDPTSGYLCIGGDQFPPSWPTDDLEALGVVWVQPEAPAPTLDEAKAVAREQLRAVRWASHIVVTFNGVAFASDDTAATRLVAAISARQIAQGMGLEQAGATAGWEAKDGSTVAMTLNDQRGLLLAGVAKTQRAFDRQAVLMAAIDAAETVAAVTLIDLTDGWPE